MIEGPKGKFVIKSGEAEGAYTISESLDLADEALAPADKTSLREDAKRVLTEAFKLHMEAAWSGEMKMMPEAVAQVLIERAISGLIDKLPAEVRALMKKNEEEPS